MNTGSDDSGPVANRTTGENDAAPDSQGRIFILKVKETSLRTPEVFLKNRGWEVRSGVDLRAAITEILIFKPDYVLICSDHPNTRVKALPRVINQSIQTKIIGYADNNPKNLNVFAMDSGFSSQVLFPPVSGPAIERMILRIQREEKRAKESQNEHPRAARSGENPNDDDLTIAIKGNRAAQDDSRVQNFSSSSSVDGSRSQSALTHGIDARVFQGEQATKIEATTDRLPIRQGSKSTSESESDGRFSESDLEHPHRKARARTASEDQQNLTDSDIDEISGSLIGRTFSDEGLGQSDSELNDNQSGTNSSSGANADENDPLSGESIDEMERLASSLNPYWKREDHDVFVRGSERALSESIRDKTGQNTKLTTQVNRVKSISRLGCIEVNTDKIKGYLLAAWPYQRKLDQDLISIFRNRLVEFMKEVGEDLNLSEMDVIDIQEVTFEGWAMRQASFLKKAHYDESEVVIAFFPDLVDDASLESTEDQEMAKLSLDEIKGNETVQFGVYLHLEANKKYVLYTRNGGRMYDNQKNRLVERGLKSVFLRKDAAIDLRRYRIQNFLNDKISKISKK